MKNKKIICIIAAVALMVVAAFSSYRIYSHYAQVDEQTEVFDELAAVNEGMFDLVEWILFDEHTEKVYEAEVDKLY